MPDNSRLTPIFNANIAAAVIKPVVAPQFIPAVVAAGPAPAVIKAPLVMDRIPVLQALPAVRAEQVKLFNPVLAAGIAQIRPTLTGVPRQQIKVPVTLAADVTDEALFEDAADPAKKYYLPRYRLAQQNNQYQIQLKPSGAGCVLALEFEKYPAPALGTSARTATELPHAVAVILKHRLRVDVQNGGEKELELQVTPHANGLTATLQCETADQRDLLYQALTNPAYGTSLAVRRLFSTALPVPPPPPNTPIAAGNLVLEANGKGSFDQAATIPDVCWEVPNKAGRRLVAQGAAKLVNLGAVDFDAVTEEQLKSLTYSTTPLTGAVADSQAVLLATPNWTGVFVNHPLGLAFDTSRQQWALLQQDLAALPAGATFNIFRVSGDCFVHRTAAANLSGHISYLDHAATNNNPEARVWVTPVAQGVFVGHAIGVWYDTTRAKWAVFTQDRSPLPEGALFNVFVKRGRANVKVPQANLPLNPIQAQLLREVRVTPAPALRVKEPVLNERMFLRDRLLLPDNSFVHKAEAANTVNHCTFLDAPLTNEKPDVLLSVTANYTGVYDTHALGVWYDQGRKKWAVIHQDQTPIPAGASFNVEVRQPGKTAFAHRATPANSANHCTYLDLPGELLPNVVFAVQTNRGNFAKVQVLEEGETLRLRWQTYRGPNETLYRETTRSLDSAPERDPFVFPPNLYGYIFAGLTAAGDKVFKTILREVSFGNVPHKYFQDPVERHVFYYLPDSFKLSRRPDGQHYPMLSVQFNLTKGSEEPTDLIRDKENTSAALDFWLFPYTDPRRIAAAQQDAANASESLRAYVTPPMPPGGLELKPWLPEQAKLTLMLPRKGGGSVPQEISCIGNMRDGFMCSLTLPLEDFQDVYDALFAPGALLFQGQVQVPLPDDPTVGSKIRFSAQANDLLGEVLDYQESTDQASGGLRVEFRNACESKVRLEGLSAFVQRGAAQANAAFEGLTLPVEVEPGASLRFLVRPATPLAGAEPLHAFFDLSQVKVLPEPESFWRAIFSTRQQPKYERVIEVEVPAELFQAAASDKLSKVLVYFNGCNQVSEGDGAFKSGNGVGLTAERSTGKAKVHCPIQDLVIRKRDEGGYEYRVKLVLASGKQRERKDENGHEVWLPGADSPLLPELLWEEED